MGPNCLFSFINRYRRIICICIGVLSMVPWFILSYYLGAAVFPMNMVYYNHGIHALSLTPALSVLICLLGGIIFSALMVFGAINRIAICILPWLAIHFVMGMFTIAMVFCHIVFLIIVERKEYLINTMILTNLGSVALIISWVIVYPYWKSLVFSELVQPTCPKEEPLTKTRTVTEAQIV